MSLVGSGTGWNCFVMMGYLCYRDAAECNRVRSNIAAAQKEQGATPEDLALIGACQSKPVMWCHTIQTENGGLLWCGGGDDEEGKGQCLYHVEQLTGGEPKPGVSGCALLH